jgi:hypothetical protein
MNTPEWLRPDYGAVIGAAVWYRRLHWGGPDSARQGDGESRRRRRFLPRHGTQTDPDRAAKLAVIRDARTYQRRNGSPGAEAPDRDLAQACLASLDVDAARRLPGSERLHRHCQIKDPEAAPREGGDRLIAFLAFPVLAQDGTGPMPENAEARSYGGGWDCDLGYRVEGEECVAIDIPENAYATGRSYGSGWACRRGYEEVGGNVLRSDPGARECVPAILRL